MSRGEAHNEAKSRDTKEKENSYMRRRLLTRSQPQHRLHVQIPGYTDAALRVQSARDRIFNDADFPRGVTRGEYGVQKRRDESFFFLPGIYQHPLAEKEKSESIRNK